jgi:hypothetical protein
MGTSSPTANLVVMAGAIHAAALLDLVRQIVDREP